MGSKLDMSWLSEQECRFCRTGDGPHCIQPTICNMVRSCKAVEKSFSDAIGEDQVITPIGESSYKVGRTMGERPKMH